jgi:mannose-6-phosphate isomerase-like protein (cupin superfamily)
MRVIEQSELPHGEIEGRDFGSEVSLMLVRADEAGRGPKLHQHPYSETFVIHHGSARFWVGDEQLVAHGGQLLVVPALTPHRFETLGPFQSTNIHASDSFITEWL